MTLKRTCLILALIAVVFKPSSLFAWSESGHAIIAIMAHKMLPEDKQEALKALIEKHPNYKKDFRPPSELPTDAEREKWIIGRIGYWPDVARDYEEYNRPTWHYQLGASMTMGDVSRVPIPVDPVRLPSNATMQTQELYVLQALELTAKLLMNKKNSDADRAIAACWVAHLIGDMHLPCHSGSLYAPYVFDSDSGDRGANSIKIGDQRLHGLWDQLLGNDYERGDVNRRIFELTDDPKLVKRAKIATKQMNPQAWLLESRAAAVQYLYVGEVQQAIRAAIERRSSDLPPIRLSDAYGKQAGQLAQIRAVEAAARLAKVFERCL